MIIHVQKPPVLEKCGVCGKVVKNIEAHWGRDKKCQAIYNMGRSK